MSTKVSSISPANIAFIKYWGMRDEVAILPENVSLSMTLSCCVSHCTAETLAGNVEDEVWWKNERDELVPAPEKFREGVLNHLQQLRRYVSGSSSVRVAIHNNFPTGAGIASSASAFSSLALTISHLWKHHHPKELEQLSFLSRLSGSGSAARSVTGGYVEWPGNAEDAGSGARQLASADHWQLYDIIAVVDTSHKGVSSREGHRRAASSPYYSERQRLLPARLEQVRQAILQRDFTQLADAVERESIDLHVIAMTSTPPVFYWLPATLAVLAAVRRLRTDGLEVCATLDAGPNVHVICSAAHYLQVKKEISQIPGVLSTITDRVGNGPHITEAHLF
ncbi:diphosphomevalonate decarboxylase [Enterobacter asburiae]